MKILVLGIGQPYRKDDAAGLEAVKLWQKSHPVTAGSVDVEYVELPGLELIDMIAGRDAVVLVDAADRVAGNKKVVAVGMGALDSFSHSARSAHGVGVAEALKLSMSLEPMQKLGRISLIVIAGEDFSLGEGLSDGVKETLLEAATLIETTVQNYSNP